MKSETTHDLIAQLVKITTKLNGLEKVPVDFGTQELLHPSEIHTIEAVGNQFNTVTAISNYFGITKGAVSQVITKLHKKNYIRKERNEAYPKEVILSLTDKGKKAYETHKKLHEIMDSGMTEFLDSYPEEWIQTFQTMLVQFEKQIDKYMHLGDLIKFL
ncbi:MarR family transcriptional regulator [Desulfovibrio sp. Huiquan2017]|uniref:MarR family winged helix-turn-helix transcriptional regulator n=1 Tax=Desulfovibrio sp. Huiquan2017 TaxID=2816861 RepID=UPI001A91A721|nr:MarR family transcriptional regulator [Desulfovibrio sp. Huiquan2017]